MIWVLFVFQVWRSRLCMTNEEFCRNASKTWKTKPENTVFSLLLMSLKIDETNKRTKNPGDEFENTIQREKTYSISAKRRETDVILLSLNRFLPTKWMQMMSCQEFPESKYLFNVSKITIELNSCQNKYIVMLSLWTGICYINWCKNIYFII